MVREALTGYWSLVSGLTEVTLERARTAAKALVAQGDATREQVSGLAQEIVDTSKANREALLKLIRYEAERAAGRLGFASSDEVAVLQGRVRELERSIAQLRVAADAADSTPATAADSTPVTAAEQPAGTARATAAKTTAAKAAPTPPTPPAEAAASAKAGKADRAADATNVTKAAKSARSTKATRTADRSAGSGSPS